jgi:hypothetical protein
MERMPPERSVDAGRSVRVKPVKRRIATRLRVGSSTDVAEQEADRVADEVMRRLADGTSAVPESVSATAPGALGRAHATDDQPPIGPGGGQVDGHVAAAIGASSGRGRSLDDGVRARMESAFGADMGAVRIHTGAEATALNHSVGARAFTTGSDIYFADGEYRPGTAAGQHLLAHELTHTVQQSGGVSRIRRTSRPPIRVAADRPGRIRRLAYNQAPTTWPAANTLNRRRSGEGAEGVFFVNDAGAVFTPGTVVVKPLRSSGEIKFANQFLAQGMGFDTPNEVTYDKNSADGLALQTVLTTAGVVGLKAPNEAQNQIAGATGIMVMSMVQGKSLQTLNDAEATEFLRNEDALKQVGHLMVSDAFLGNQDRLVGLSPVNLGNFFYAVAGGLQAGKITTIDNDSSFVAATRTAHGALDGELSTKVFFIDQLCTAAGKNVFINKFLNRMRQAHAANANALAELTNNPGWITHKVSTGIDEGLRDIAQVFQTNMNLVRAVGAINDPHSAGKRQVNEAKGIANYMKDVQSGTTPANALTKLSTYIEYRTMRNKFPKGFKWMTRVGMDRGF